MDSEYDQKFEEMKKYIPFLESMIKRLETTNNEGANPRKAQLDKIRSLRDLLLDKKKRMKMENLLKCEQVLVNLYAKVEQRDAMIDVPKAETDKEEKEKSDLNIVRNKLKTVVSQLQDDPDTLPEIARANNTGVNCTLGSKEPALFQRRPNKTSPEQSPSKHDSTSCKSTSKRNYTRVLLSPDRKPIHWSATDDTHKEKQLYSRRSPRKSPRSYSPPFHKKERKKTSKQRSESKYSKDLNITLKVPEESLGSLNTKDILSRILNCHDGDVDIATLRELRTQILGELKQTGAKDDISDLILKSYANKKQSKKKDDIEEGELSDSESEAIESIYGSLVIMDKDSDNSSTNKTESEKQAPRKIQICLVINSEKEKSSEQNKISQLVSSDIEGNADDKIDDESTVISQKTINPSGQESEEVKTNAKGTDTQKIPKEEGTKTEDVVIIDETNDHGPSNTKTFPAQAFKPNFYQPLVEIINLDSPKERISSPLDELKDLKSKQEQLPFLETDKCAKTSEEKDALSQIDILQALKKEILGEAVSENNTNIKTPPLHQPKITKVASAQEMSKKRISIENYKQKSVASIQQKFPVTEPYVSTSKDDSAKKQSLKLTEKECERFNLMSSLTAGDSSDEGSPNYRTDRIDEIYGDLAPKSPDHDDFADTGIKPPVIIPIDPVKTIIVNSKADVDMRTTIPLGQCGSVDTFKKGSAQPNVNLESLTKSSISEMISSNEKNKKPIKPNNFIMNSERNTTPSYSNKTPSMVPPGVPPNMPPCMTPSIVPCISPIIGMNPIMASNMTPGMPPGLNPGMPPSMNPGMPSSIAPVMPPNMNPVMTSNMTTGLSPSMNSGMSPCINPSIPNMHPGMTPNRNPMMTPNMNISMTPIMTPNARSYEMTPRNSFENDDFTGNHIYAPIFPGYDGRDFSENDVNKKRVSRGDLNDPRSNSNQRDLEFQKNRNERYKSDVYSPRMDSPGSSSSSFGRVDSPVNPYGRSDRPVTPFGRSDPNMNSNNAFNRGDYQNNSSFNSQKYGKGHESRFNKSADYDMYQNRYDERERSYHKGNSYSSSSGYRREHNMSGIDRSNSYDNSGRNRRERKHFGESSGGRSYSREYAPDRSYNRDHTGNDYRYHGENTRNYEDNKRNYREKSVGRTNSTEDRYSSPRDGGTGRYSKENAMEKRVSLQSHSGRSFNNDTSFNRTFQESSHNSFEARKQRASSVGRMLVETATQKKSIDFNFDRDVSDKRKRADFRRASSVGRELKDYNKDKNFKDIKADLQSFKFKDFSRGTKDFRNMVDNIYTGSKTNDKSLKSRDPRFTKDLSIKLSDKNVACSAYSPRRNYRDPRLRREMFNEAKGSDKNKNQDNSLLTKHGIVYSNDNIAKGVLSSGCGVRNYKIPKIKRPVCQPDVISNKTDESTKDNLDLLTSDSKKVINVNDKPNENVKSKINVSKEKQSEDKLSNKEINKYDSNIKNIKLKSKRDAASSTTKKEDKDNNQVDDLESITSASDYDNSERRITRSLKKAKAYQTKETRIELRRLNRIKRPLDDDSDTDSQGSVISNEAKQNTDEEKIQNVSSVNKKALIVKTKTKSGDCIKNEQNVIAKEMPSAGPIGRDSKNVEDAENLNIKDTDTECKGQRDSLDTSFGADDDLSSSENAVLNNIHALIADLDSDIEAPKMCDQNEKCLSQITECLSDTIMTGEENNLKETKNTSAMKNEDHSEIEKPIVSENVLICSEINSSLGISGSNTERSNPPLKSDDSTSQPKNCVVGQIADDTTSCNEAVVSTTASDIKTSEIPRVFEVATNIADTASVSSFIPDSTININDTKEKENSQESVPDSTNQASSDMNSDISSTHNLADTLCEKTSDSISFPNKLPQLDSLGKLLSILEDKNKIKELLSLLGTESGDNEKIKKKLEKLSEIVSEDEEVTTDKSAPQVQTLVTSNKSNVDSNVVDSIEKIIDTTAPEGKEECAKEFDDGNVTDIHLQNEDALNEKKDTVEIKTLPLEDNNDSKLTGTLNADQKIDDDLTNDSTPASPKTNKKTVKKWKSAKRAKGRFTKKPVQNKVKRVTRSDAASTQTQSGPKKPSRELLKLHEDIREMFISDDVLNATGIRMCRLAKMVEREDDLHKNETDPVVSEKGKNKVSANDSTIGVDKPIQSKKKTNKGKSHDISENDNNKDKPSSSQKIKPGPKSKTKKQDDDPYVFETDSVADSNVTVDSRDQNITDSDSDSMVSTRSFESSEQLEVKKRGRPKGRGGKVGVVKGKYKKKKDSTKTEFEVESKNEEHIDIPDLNCFIDKSYCFMKSVRTYSCRLCVYTGDDIVPHYKKHHPHSEIPLSRINPETAQDAIEQCEDMNLQAISKIPTEKYICRFCFKELKRKNASLEAFFWHVVSMHTGEYKQLCSECLNVTRCPFNLDIPPPPKNVKGQLIGYICGRCNFTQISLENLKSHVIVRHDDEQTEVYSINLAMMSRKTTQALLKKIDSFETPRVLRSSRSNQSATEQSDDRSDYTEGSDYIPSMETVRDKATQELSSLETPTGMEKNIQSKFTFESDDINESSYLKHVKLEDDDEHHDTTSLLDDSLEQSQESETIEADNHNEPSDVPDAHFKIEVNDNGSKEYICCIDGNNHYSTTLLISLKKHVQMKHTETWDGFCYLCKVIVTPQGKYRYKECLQHYLDRHMDNFPVVQDSRKTKELQDSTQPKSFINVRPLSDLIPMLDNQDSSQESNSNLPKIESVVSLGAQAAEALATAEPEEPVREYKYEEAQSEVMSKKHRVVLDTMMSHEKLIDTFKCAGRYCSYTTDEAEEALLHASTHQRIGGDNALACSYCDFDAAGNAIDLVMHVFKSHSHCPYVCSLCFYRAPASQLVNAHIKRVHTEDKENEAIVLRSTSDVKMDQKADDMLPRDAVVPYYICNNGDRESETPCKFKTYVSVKFIEHLQSKHAAEIEYSCYMCGIPFMSPKLLCQHLKSHGLQIYQCARCVYGADTEAELLAHASASHPLKQPKAYLRIITTKEGSAEVRVLPLAILNTAQVPTTSVTPSTDKEHPVKQADRSIDLEKLIGHTTFMIESVSTVTEASMAPERLDEATDNTEPAEQSAPVARRSSILICGRRTSKTSVASGDQLATVVVKQEPDVPERSEEAKETSVSDIVCLDSDEDSATQNVIDLSLEENSAVGNSKEADISKTIPRTELYKCAKCHALYKTEGKFGKHILTCFQNVADPIPCAHCAMKVNRFDLVNHYTSCHRDLGNLPYHCAVCSAKYVSMPGVKNHLKLVHGVTSFRESLQTEGGVAIHIVDGLAPKARKRKIPIETAEKNEPATKLKKYGPQDVDRLPINPILDDLVYCSLCEFNTKVRLNMVRHLQLHAEQQPVPITAPVNPVPHLETNEKHFDKMVNLASSSIVTRPDKGNKSVSIPTVSIHDPNKPRAHYPKYVPDRQRYTCGAKGCSYISLNESMLKCHWETLHASTTDYHCVHCPPHQLLDTSKSLTATRIVAHLKMHDSKLYACSSCPFYHYLRKIVEKHVNGVHKGCYVRVVREDGQAPALPAPVVAAPTMDLKAWQCGLCKYKSMLRPEVVDHCAKLHQSKMQFKCAYCGFRTSNVENVTKHQMNSHPGKAEDVFYFYYREGSVPDEDGIPRWLKQRQKTEVPEIKTEKADDVPPLETLQSRPEVAVPTTVNLDIVKKEVDTDVPVEETVEDLCNMFGQFCEPNGLKYKCSLCKNVIEDSQEAMQSHLYEELQYRRWGCGICSYKAFHKPGLQEHMQTEHRQNRDPIELPVDPRIEKWVSQLLEHQTTIILKNRENLAKQKSEILRPMPGTAPRQQEMPETIACAKKTTGGKPSMIELERLFGDLGVPSNLSFCCPKCQTKNKSEATMREHLHWELNKIRWRCSNCAEKFQTYHEVQFHCKTAHATMSARPIEAPRDLSLRTAWVSAVIHVQKLTMNYMPVSESSRVETPETCRPDPTDNSLLVVRFEKTVPTPEEEMEINALQGTDSDEDKLVIDEPREVKKTPTMLYCPFCPVMFKMKRFLDHHIVKHYNLEPFSCDYCDFQVSSRKMMISHLKSKHEDKPLKYHDTPRPPGLPDPELLAKYKKPADNSLKASSVDRLPTNEYENSPHEQILETNEPTRTPDSSTSLILDSDDDKHGVEEVKGRKATEQTCPHCQAIVKRNFHGHILKHYNLEPLTCGYCDFTGNKRMMLLHQLAQHNNKPYSCSNTPIPLHPPAPLTPKKTIDDDVQKLVCMVCEKLVSETEMQTHMHDGLQPEYSKKGEVVVKCCVCLTLHKDINVLQRHHDNSHPEKPLNYAFYKLHKEKNRGIISHRCGYCDQRFTYLRDLKTHSNAVHSSFKIKYTIVPSTPDASCPAVVDLDTEEVGNKRLSEDVTSLPPPKRTARKSTTKLPESIFVARKSTTKLPFDVDEPPVMSDVVSEYSYYGTKPSMENLDNVTTLMPFCNKMVPFTLQRLSEIINIDPVVLIQDIYKNKNNE